MGSQAYQAGDNFFSGNLQVGMVYEWVRVLEDGTTPYEFPHRVSQHMRQQHSGPAIYRWTIHRQADITGVYIGETEALPRRIYHYLKPGPTQQTNIRLHKAFTVAKEHGLSVTLEVLRFTPSQVAGHSISQASLEEKTVRVLLEHLMLWVYQDAPLINA